MRKEKVTYYPISTTITNQSNSVIALLAYQATTETEIRLFYSSSLSKYDA